MEFLRAVRRSIAIGVSLRRFEDDDIACVHHAVGESPRNAAVAAVTMVGAPGKVTPVMSREGSSSFSRALYQMLGSRRRRCMSFSTIAAPAR